MTEPRPTDTGTEPEQTVDRDPIGAIVPPKAGKHGVRALALAGFGAAAGLLAAADTPTPPLTIR
jgi:hypothetical protein